MNLSGRAKAAIFFLQQTAETEPETLFLLYARYLIQSSGIRSLPISLRLIREHHGFQRRAASIQSRGFLVGNSSIFVNSDDLSTVQRFTEAHELMEMLFLALEDETPSRFSPKVRQWFLANKEQLCEQGAAELLMPADLFDPLLEGKALSLATGSELSGHCRTSLTATIRRIISTDIAPCVFGYLQEGYRKSEQRLIEAGQGAHLQPELRVWKRWKSPQTKGFLCPNESFSRDTSIYQTFQSGIFGQINSGFEKLNLKKIQGVYYTESMLITIKETPTVIVLIQC